MAEPQYYAFLFFLWFISTLLVRSFFKNRTNRAKARLPPSPPALPFLGHLHLLKPPTHQSLQNLAHRYGPLIHLRLGYVNAIVVSSAGMAREFLKTHDHAFASRPLFAVARRNSYGPSGFAFAPYGPYWRFMKKLTLTELLSSRQLDRFLAVRRQEIRRFLQSLFDKSRTRKPIDVEAELTALTNNVICRMTISTRCSGSENEADECRKLVKETTLAAGKFDPADFIKFCENFDFGIGKRLREVLSMFDDLVERIIKEHEEKRRVGGDRNGERDLLDILLEIHEDDKGEVKLTRQHIKAFILDFFIGGTDTSSVAMQWALAELINHPDVFKKAREEIDSVVGKSRLVEESDLPTLPYVQAIIKETLRLHPTAPLILRESTQACTVAGFDIPEKTRIFINAYAIGRDPTSWEDPLEFRPERFLVSDESGRNPVDVKGQHFEVLPFGSGRRGCPGASLALHVMQTSIAAMIQCFDWEVEGNKVDMTEGPGFILPMAHSLECSLVPRFDPFIDSQ